MFYATLAHAGRPTPEIAAEIVGEVMRGFPWPKSMRSGASSFRWVRPLKRVLFLFDGKVVPFEINGLQAADITEGHRFMGSRGAPFTVRDADDYKTRLNAEFVALEAAQRRQTILDKGYAGSAARGLELVEDEGLLEEVAGLAEWPTPLIGDMDPAFLDLPPEVIRTSMRTHQKYFAVRPAGAGERGDTALAPHFLVVANIEAGDGGEEIKRGNAKVLSARLSDARFFWDEDRKAGAFDRWLGKLQGVTFHAKLGTMAERVERIAALAEEIAPAVGADPKLARIAAKLAKADLASAMVGEFPELQGIMGGYYVRQAPYAEQARAAELLRAAEPDGQEDPLSEIAAARPGTAGSGDWWDGLSRLAVDEIADAVRDHYKPVGPSDSVPSEPVTLAVALADKFDTLAGFWTIGEKPTGSKDPYALRRAALGIIRLILANSLRFSVDRMFDVAVLRNQLGPRPEQPEVLAAILKASVVDGMYGDATRRLVADAETISPAWLPDVRDHDSTISDELRGFLQDRLKVDLREGVRQDVIDACLRMRNACDLALVVARGQALTAFLATDDGANLLAGYKRAVNILRAEQKKNPEEAYEGALDAALFSAPEEQALAATLGEVRTAMEPLLAAEDFSGAMGQLAKLRGSVDAFFIGVLVNDADAAVRMNRLRLLATIQATANQVADFSLIQG